MGKIIHLPKSVIAKISAGEVIERPSYVVKELIENAIDAKADSITIHIEDSGLTKIQVIDTGIGMSREDLEICFIPHTTSKISSEEDLFHIQTLGFRGEALSSIATISYMSIKSRTADSTAGTEVLLKEGSLEDIHSTGMPKGTAVTVNNLFYSLPVRKKFLKSKLTEFRHITEVVSNFSFIYPQIHFLLTHNKKTVLDLPKKEVIERIKVVWGELYFQQLLPVLFEDAYIKIEGFIGKPQIAGVNNNKQVLFINKRKITDKLLQLAIKEGFGTLLPQTSTPAYILNITIPHEMIDVNIHPRKETVSFIDARIVFDILKYAVTQVLLERNITYNSIVLTDTLQERKGETQTFAASLLKEKVLPWDRESIGELQKKSQVIQIHNLYLFVVTKRGVLLLDQHASHERVIYEQFLEVFEKERQKRTAYVLPKPKTIEFSLVESQIFDEYKESLLQIGFDIEHFQGNAFVIRKIPVVFKGRNVEKIIQEMLASFSDDIPKTIDSRTQRMLAFLACRSSVKSGDSLTPKQCSSIVKELLQTKNNTTCPHGRPTRIEISIENLNSIFKR